MCLWTEHPEVAQEFPELEDELWRYSQVLDEDELRRLAHHRLAEINRFSREVEEYLDGVGSPGNYSEIADELREAINARAGGGAVRDRLLDLVDDWRLETSHDEHIFDLQCEIQSGLAILDPDSPWAERRRERLGVSRMKILDEVGRDIEQLEHEGVSSDQVRREYAEARRAYTREYVEARSTVFVHDARHRRASHGGKTVRCGSRRGATTRSASRGGDSGDGEGDPEPPAPAPGAERRHRGGRPDHVNAPPAAFERGGGR